MSQGLLTLPTTGTLAGLTAVQDINAANAALATMLSGASAPTTTSTGLSSTAGLLWHDTTANLLKLRDQADTTWIILGSFDETNKGFTPYNQGFSLATTLRGCIAGYILSNDTGTPNTKLDVTTGAANDDTDVAFIQQGGTVIDFTTSGLNGLDTGTIAATTWYHIFAISKVGGGLPAFLASLNLNSPTFPAGYTLKRRIGSVRTDASAHILAFKQFGEEFLWSADPALDISADTTLTTADKLYTLSYVPPGVQVLARIRVSLNNSALSQAVVRSPDQSGTVNLNNITTGAPAQTGYQEFLVRTDTSQRVSMRSNVATGNIVSILVSGWIDYRAKFN